MAIRDTQNQIQKEIVTTYPTKQRKQTLPLVCCIRIYPIFSAHSYGVFGLVS